MLKGTWYRAVFLATILRERDHPMRACIVGAAVAAALLCPAAAVAAPGPSGQIVFSSDRAGSGRDLYLVNRDGGGLQRLTFDLLARAPQWSPTGDRIAFSARGADGNWDINTVATDGSSLRRLTTDPGRDDYPGWTADGRIVWQHDPDGTLACPCQAWIMNADGTDKHQLDTGGDAFAPAPAPRGNRLVFGNGAGLVTMQLNGQARRQITTVAGDFQPRWSPTANNIAFLRDTTGTDNDIFVVHSDGTDLRRLTDSPSRPEFALSWANDGSELIFYAQDADASHLYAMRPDGSAETRLSTAPEAPYTDTFDHGVVDTSFWYTLTDPGSALDVQDGRLIESIAGTAVPGGQFDQTATAIGSPCHLPSDFDMQIDYQLLQWPEHGGFFAALMGIFGDINASRASAPWDPPYNQSYNAWSNSSNGFSGATENTRAAAGSLRIARVGSTGYAYVRDAGQTEWRLLLTADGNTGEAIPQISLFAQAGTFGHQDGSVAWDNLKITSGRLSCPTWWNDSWPDASPTGQ
jgi:Tol biopolymer transport system component